MNITVRPMCEEDIEPIFELGNRCFAQSWSKKSLRDELNNSFAHYLVLIDGETVIGYGGMWIIIDEAHVTNIAVAQEYRRKGLGTMLVKGLMENACESGAQSMTLEVRKSNQAAILLYESLGFAHYGIRKKYYSDNGEDAIIMWNKQIAQKERVEKSS